ncbi:MAG: RsiV family protein [Dysgonamonadaceae bacterium]|jgi:hypothetical protein|nr:RsiV family protein [Dysgonamonadaceae bacterium]
MITVNKLFVLNYISTLILICVSFSCSNTAVSIKTDIGFDTLRIEDTFISESEKTALVYKLEIKFIYPETCSDTEKLSQLQSAFIDKFFTDDKLNAFTPKQALDSFVAKQRNYIQSINLPEDMLNEDSPQDSVILCHLKIKNYINFHDCNIVSFLVETENYEGGIRPMRNVFGYVYSIQDENFITEDEFAGINYKKNLAEIISEKIEKDQDCKNGKQLEDIGFDPGEIFPNGNFTIDRLGITYYYNESEIAPSSIGIIKVFIPFDELEVYIRKENTLAYLYDK